MNIRELAEQHGYLRYTATYDDEKGGDVDRGTEVGQATSEIPGNRFYCRSPDGRPIQVARLFRVI